ncbi:MULTISPECIES: DUF2062 domain-containing protein [unclassified Paracoccus (in: a-proteobacteria)]|uniref:DUF2062 domain-containing protein n=1 Tax=unclassified Paracoccus (in: a-proteobacteria) TaxID=2688777 RepID=UPI001F3EF4DC|nr:DUF2062 domain-containing protein [Paracoccus sp. MC1862]
MFKRKPRSYSQIASEMVYPRGGWSRAAQYLGYRVRRLPDQPHRIARGFAAGTFINFTPLFGFHLLGAFALAWVMRGNLLAAALGTLIGNPVTIPFMAMTSMALGRWMLGVDGSMTPAAILNAFASAGRQLTHNFMSIFDDRVAQWDQLETFFHAIFLPYLVGSIIPGTIAAVIAHYLSLRVVEGYHRHRAARMAKRAARQARKQGGG